MKDIIPIYITKYQMSVNATNNYSIGNPNPTILSQGRRSILTGEFSTMIENTDFISTLAFSPCYLSSTPFTKPLAITDFLENLASHLVGDNKELREVAKILLEWKETD